MDTLSKTLIKHLENAILQVVRTGDKKHCLDLIEGSINAVASSLNSIRTANYPPDTFSRLKFEERVPLMLSIERLKSELLSFPQ